MITNTPHNLARRLSREWERAVLGAAILALGLGLLAGTSQLQAVWAAHPPGSGSAPDLDRPFHSALAWRFLGPPPSVELGEDHAFLRQQDPDPRPLISAPETVTDGDAPGTDTGEVGTSDSDSPDAGEADSDGDTVSTEPVVVVIEPTPEPDPVVIPPDSGGGLATIPAPPATLAYAGFLTGPSGRTQALLVHRAGTAADRRYVRLGDVIAGFSVLAADADGVTLRGPTGRRRHLARGEILELPQSGDPTTPDSL